jgi:1-acyl-sn-glycerol-3-phosphate acyltransferase
MTLPDYRPLRIAATGFCFALFGLGGLLILCGVLPFLRCRYADSVEAQQRARDIIHRSFRVFVRVMVFCGTISYEVRNVERLARNGLLVVANHPSLIDVVLLISLLRQPNCVVKSSLRNNLFTRGPVRSAGFVVNTEGAQLIEDCIASVRSGDNLVIFPEGTRSLAHNGALNPLKRGAVNIALRGKIALTPVVITVSEPMLGKGQGWRRAPMRRPHFVLCVEEDILVERYLAQEEASPAAENAPSRRARALAQDLKDFFTGKIKQQCMN